MSDDEPITVTRAELRTELCSAIDETLSRRRSMDDETHAMHHEWITDRIEVRRRQEQLKLKIKENVLGWLIIAIVGGIGSLIFAGYKTLTRAMTGHE